jgi:DNA-binding NarL/FixJ family response regulator
MNGQNKYRVGFVDEDPQWIEIFKRKLKDHFDIVIISLSEDTSIREIIAQIEKAKLDCLIVDFDLKETDVIQFNGDEIVDEIRKKYPYFPVFVITGQNEDIVIAQVEDNDIVRDKSEINEKTSTLIQRIKNKITNYFKQIEDAEAEIKRLVELKNSTGLKIEDEEILIEKYQFLEKINPEDKEIPDNLIQPESITRLNEFANNTKQILEELRKLNK